jgi:predicted nucleotidyltransferase
VAKEARSPLQQSIAQIARDLAELDAPFALVGGLAVSSRVEPRFTRDVDLVVSAQTDLEVERLVFALLARGYRVDASIEQTSTGRLATVRTRPPGAGELIIDLLFASSGIEDVIVERAEVLEVLQGIRLPVASCPALVALKVLARARTRPQDDLDLAGLIPLLSEPEVLEVEELLRLIAARGYSRGKRLGPEFKRLLKKWRKSSG